MIRIDVTISEIMDLCRSLSSIDSYTKNQVDEILKDIHVNKNLINRTINQLTDLDIKAEQLMSLLIEKKEQVEGLIARTEIVLLNTPKEISETHYDDNGDLYTITKPNPEYAKLLEELRNYKLELWGIENRIESCKSVQQRISSYSQKLSNALYSIKL